MNGRTSAWLTRPRVVAMVVLGVVIAGVVVLTAQAQTKQITLKSRLPATQPSAAAAADPATASAPPAAKTPTGHVLTDGSKFKIDIGLSYHGERVDFFGTVAEPGADAVIVKITSPAETVKLNQKGRVGPFWMGTKQHTVENLPFMYHINASDKLDAILSADQQRELGIGFEAIRQGLVIHTTKGKSAPEDEKVIFEGVLQLKKDQELYRINDEKGVTITQSRLFKHTVTFPAATKQGEYKVETYAFRQGRLVGRGTDVIQVKKVGLGANVVRWANTYPKIYGVCAVILALGAGLLVGFIFKKGGHH